MRINAKGQQQLLSTIKHILKAKLDVSRPLLCVGIAQDRAEAKPRAQAAKVRSIQWETALYVAICTSMHTEMYGCQPCQAQDDPRL